MILRPLLLLCTLAWPVTRTHQDLIDLAGRKGDVTHLYDLYQRSEGVTPEEFGAVGNCATDDGAAINAAINSLAPYGGQVLFAPGRCYAVNPASNRVRVRANTTLDLRGARIKRIGADTLKNLIENFNYDSAAVPYDSNIVIQNGRIIGNGSTTAQSHASPAGNIFFFFANRVILRDLILDSAVGDCLGWRLANNMLVSNVRTGAFGRNAFSPTSGTNNRIENCDFTAPGFTGAIPGEHIDVENDSRTEVSSTYWINVKSRGATFVDFWSHADSATGNTFAHEASFENCHFTGSSPQTFRVIASNPVRARNFIVGNTNLIAISDSTATAFKIGKVNGVRCHARLLNNSAGTGTSRAIESSDTVVDFTFKGAIDTSRRAFANGLVATTYPFFHSNFYNSPMGTSNLYAGSKQNRFYGCGFQTFILSQADSNTCQDCSITTLSVKGSANDFQGSTIRDLTIDSSGSQNNRFRLDTRIFGSKTFTGSSTWLGQIFERDEDTLSITVTGSSSGSATLSARWGRYNVIGDVVYYSTAFTISASTGVGDQRINLGFPHSIVPADAITPSRWAASVSCSGIPFTGSQIIGDISGGIGFISLYGLANTGTTTAIPASTAAGTCYVSGFFRIR